MKILIVEDEHHSRKHLADILAPFHEIMECDNVLDAMNFLEKEKPDIVLTDICMPQKTGIDLAAYIAAHDPDLIVIMITGFSDFQYTKAAIEYSVFDYILKPVSRELLLEVIEKASKKISEAARKKELQSLFQRYFSENQAQIRQKYFEDLLFRRIHNEENADRHIRLGFAYGRFRLVAVKPVHKNQQLSLEGEYYLTSYLEKYIRQKLPDTVSATFGNIMYCIWEVKSDDHFDDNLVLSQMLTDMQQEIREIFFCGLLIGISNSSQQEQELYLLRKQAIEATADQETAGVFFYEDIVTDTLASSKIRYDLSQLASWIRKGNKSRVLRIVEKQLASPQETDADTQNIYEMMISTVLYSLSGTELFSGEIRSSSEELFQKVVGGVKISRSSFDSWIASVCDTVSGINCKKGANLVNTILKYVNENYSSNIGLEEVSRVVCRNSSYISRVIKEKTDKSFTALLTQRRIEAAKHLLKHSTKKINDIALEVGYPNPNYFDRVFKQAVNMNPNEYREITNAFRE